MLVGVEGVCVCVCLIGACLPACCFVVVILCAAVCICDVVNKASM